MIMQEVKVLYANDFYSQAENISFELNNEEGQRHFQIYEFQICFEESPCFQK